MDTDIIVRIMMFIPEIVWHGGIRRTIPLEMLYDRVLECFNYSSGKPVVILKHRDMAYLSAKAFLHLAIQRKCFDDKDVLEPISSKHSIMGSKDCGDDCDLSSTLGVIDHIFDKSGPVCWEDFSFTAAHHAWMGHILLYRTWDVLREHQPLPEDVKEFVRCSFRLKPPPPEPVVADCLFIIGLNIGIELNRNDLLTSDKR
jgi:hypothetical protein